MNSISKNTQQANKKERGVIALICSNLYKYIPSVLFHSDESVASIEIDREGQFAAYVNNRMNLLLMWAQRVQRKEMSSEKMRLEFFLYDLEHHFVDSYAEKKTRDAFRWLRVYVKVYPNKFFDHRSERVIEMIGRIYEALGIEFKFKQEEHTHCLTTNII